MLRVIFAWYCALLLWLSGAQHVASSFHFFGTILDYHLVPEGVAWLVAAAFPWAHLMLAVVLIAPGSKSKTPFVATALLGTIFLCAQLTVCWRGIPVDCGCFGGMAERTVGPTSLCIAGSLVLASCFGAFLANSNSVQDESSLITPPQ